MGLGKIRRCFAANPKSQKQAARKHERKRKGEGRNIEEKQKNRKSQEE